MNDVGELTLKPCQWCNGNPTISKHITLGKEDGTKIKNLKPFFVHCNNEFCEMMPITNFHKTKRDAIIEWNDYTHKKTEG